MPAAAIIPAPIAYANAVAVKKLVVGFRARGCIRPTEAREISHHGLVSGVRGVDQTLCIRPRLFTHRTDLLKKPP